MSCCGSQFVLSIYVEQLIGYILMILIFLNLLNQLETANIILILLNLLNQLETTNIILIYKYPDFRLYK